VNAMLLNEFLKEHKKVEEQDHKIQQQQATIAQQRKDLETTAAQQQKQIELLIAQIKEQATQIQKVSTQIGIRKPVARIALSNP